MQSATFLSRSLGFQRKEPSSLPRNMHQTINGDAEPPEKSRDALLAANTETDVA